MPPLPLRTVPESTTIDDMKPLLGGVTEGLDFGLGLGFCEGINSHAASAKHGLRVLGFAVGVDSVFLEVKVPGNPVQIGKVLSMYRRPGRKDWTVNDPRCGDREDSGDLFPNR